VHASAMPAIQDPGPADMSVEAVLSREIARLGEWLSAEGLDLREGHARDAKARCDELSWRYGYFVGLKQALSMLTSHGHTVH
jgi:hypothetical protein